MVANPFSQDKKIPLSNRMPYYSTFENRRPENKKDVERPEICICAVHPQMNNNNLPGNILSTSG
jgi:hypothetical protein